MWYLENDQLCSGKPINATDSYQALQERERERERERDTHARARAHTHTHTNCKECFSNIFVRFKGAIHC